MGRGKYVETRRGQAAALGQRRMRRFRLALAQQPQSKNISATDAVAFQQAVAAQLDKAGSSAFTGPVFLQFEFTTVSKTPPAIYKLSKNYLDLLEVPRADAGIDRSRLLYKNDRQVKALIVRYRLEGINEQPRIWVQAEPWRSFLADVDLLRRVRRDDFEDGGDTWGAARSDDFLPSFAEDERGDCDGVKRLVEFEREKASFVRAFGSDAYGAQHEMMRRTMQQDELRRTDRFICSGVLSAFQGTPRTKGGVQNIFLAQLAAATRNMSLGTPFVLDLHHSPHRKGDSEQFNVTLRKALNEYKAKRRYLFPLTSQLCVTLLMVPPVDGGKDLDNLARLVLPSLHEIWAPPSHMAHTINIENIKDSAIRSFWEKMQQELPKEPKHSITEYRAFELPRLPGDAPEGFVRLAVGEGQRSVRFREEIDGALGEWCQAVSR
ncbi:MAG: hypothetical protein IT428_03405 [Planctomycetaceae bacterium]|nr:hypothetical protein [Planctomycetaceae bacterium]